MRETIQNANGKQFHAVSLSGGKDSTAMLLLMIEQDMPINMVLSADTGMEFPEMYEHLAKLDEHLFRERGIHITTLRHPKGFEYLMFDEPKQKPRSLENRARLGIPPYGNGWPGIRVRWCTGQLKTHLITKEVNRLKGELGAIHYVGIATDEAWRCKDERYPLVEWGITEAQALQACYDRGFDFGGLYEIYHRASCWCCPFQRNPDTEAPDTDNPAQLNTKKSNTQKSNTDLSSTHSFFLPAADGMTDGFEKKAEIREQIEYDILCQQYDRMQLDELVEIMLEVAMNRSPTVKIGRDAEYPTGFVQQRFEKITSMHIEKVMDGIRENTTRVWNTKAYLMAALFNSVSTIDNHYAMLVNHDFHGGP